MRIQSQRTRLLTLLGYLSILLIASRIALGSWLPPASVKGLWFYAGLATLILGDLVVSPFYTKPADAIPYATAGLVGLLTVNPWFPLSLQTVDRSRKRGQNRKRGRRTERENRKREPKEGSGLHS